MKQGVVHEKTKQNVMHLTLKVVRPFVSSWLTEIMNSHDKLACGLFVRHQALDGQIVQSFIGLFKLVAYLSSLKVEANSTKPLSSVNAFAK